jgi:hypothetical protein
LYKSIQKGGLANEIELQQRQMRALMRKYGIGYEDMGVKSPRPTPPPVTPAGTTTKTPKSWVDTLPSFDEPKPTSNYKPWEPEVFKEFVDTGGGGDSDDEMEQRVIEMYFEDGLRETEIAKLEGIPEVQVHNIIIKYLNGDRPMDEGAPELLKKEMPLVRHIDKILAGHGYKKGTTEYDEHFKQLMAYLRKFGNIDLINKQDVAKGEVSIKEYGGYETKRIIQYSKDNPPNMDYLYQQFVQRMLNPENTVDPDDWIDQVNKFYNLNFKWRDYQERGRKDHTNNWQRIIQKYVVQRP